jgi:Na+/proline symporter
MEKRFGRGVSGRLSRTISTAGQLLAILTSLGYFVIGAGKFFGPYLPFDLPSESAALLGGGETPLFSQEMVACLIIFGIALAYSLVSGYAGVVGGDLVQMTVILLAFGVLAVVAIVNTSGATIAGIVAAQPNWLDILPPARFDTSAYGNFYKGYEAMAMICSFFVIKSVLQGFGALQGYMSQRWLACRDEKDAGVMSVVWLTTLVGRWIMAMGVVLLGWVLVQQKSGSDIATLLLRDPERIFPYVLSEFLRPGLLGLVFAGLLAAALSTLVTTLNAGASFLVHDIYQEWIRPKAGHFELRVASYGAVLLLVVASIALSRSFRNINDIWTWFIAGWVGAKFVPLILFWYWHRANGYGFALGSAAGLVAAVLQRVLWPDADPMLQFLISGIPSTAVFFIGSLLTAPVEERVLTGFYKGIRPWGWWKPVSAKFTDESLAGVRQEHRRDIVAVCLAVPWMILLYLLPLLLMVRQWGRAAIVGILLLALSIGLHRVWWRWLDYKYPGLQLKNPELEK